MPQLIFQYYILNLLYMTKYILDVLFRRVDDGFMNTITEELTTVKALPVAGHLPAETERKSPGMKAMLGVCIAGACAFLNLHATQPLLPFFVQYFHVSKPAASLTVSATALAVAISAPLIGAVADRVGRKRLIVPAIFILAIPTALAAISANLVELTVWRFVQGIILPAVFAIAMSYVTEEWDEKSVGSAMATYVAGNVVGGFIGRSIAGLTAEFFGWRQAFVVLGLCTAAGGALTAWLLPRSRAKRPRQSGAIWQAIPAHLKNPGLAVTFAIGSMVLFSIIAAFTYINYRLAAAPYFFSPAALSAIFIVYLVGAVITPFAGRLIDRLGFRKAYVIATTLSILGLAITLSSNLILITLGLAIFCSGMFVCQSSTTSSLRTLAPVGRSAAAGLYVFFYYLGGSLGGYLPGLFFEGGGWNSCVAIIVGVQFLSLAIAWLFWRSAPARPNCPDNSQPAVSLAEPVESCLHVSRTVSGKASWQT
jgi:MFS transporter, YNFM family, putative membrane transport protein